MQFFEQDFIFQPAEQQKSLTDLPSDSELLGIRIRLGNRPLVTHLNRYIKKSGTPASNLMSAVDVYAIVHAIGAIRISGKATVEELQYHAVLTAPNELRTIDLVPSTRFREVISANIEIEGAISANGNAEIEVPEVLVKSLTSNYLNLGGDMKVQLSSEASFLGKFTYSLTYPVTQSAGVATNTCSWILRPDAHKNDLLGDQLMVQFLAVPYGTESIMMGVHGLVVADKGLFWREQELRTDTQEITVSLK